MKKHLNGNHIFLFAVICVTILRLLLTKGLMVYFVTGTQYDDLMQIAKAFSIADGNWLGEYGSMTLVKGVGYPLMVAFFHLLHIPYILGFHILYVIGCIAFIWAIQPIVKNHGILFLGYCFVLFNPIAFSSAITKYYRDIMYYAVCMIFISLTLGLLIHRRGKLCALLCGFSLAVCILCREDGQWLYVYSISCLLATLIFNSISNKKFDLSFMKEISCVVLSYSVVVLSICAINYKFYGTFVTDEYNSGSYAAAYGAISRLHGESGNTQVVIPYSEREKLYNHSEAFAELKPFLDNNNPQFEPWKIVNNDYRTGYFSLVLRDAIAARGYYKDAKTTNEYLNRLAEEVNTYCDENDGNYYHKRNTIVSRFYPEYIPEILKSTVQAIKNTTHLSNISCIPIQCEEDDAYLSKFETFTNSIVAGNRYMPSSEIIENYHLVGFPRQMQRLMRVIIIIYRIITPILFIVSIFILLYKAVATFKAYREHSYLYCISGLSLLLLFLLRSFMIGYVDATTFSAVDSPAYLAGSCVACIAFIALSLSVLTSDLTAACKNDQTK